jgi:hypothetical protein
MRLEIHPEDLDDDPDLHRTIRISNDGFVFADCGDQEFSDEVQMLVCVNAVSQRSYFL